MERNKIGIGSKGRVDRRGKRKREERGKERKEKRGERRDEREKRGERESDLSEFPYFDHPITVSAEDKRSISV